MQTISFESYIIDTLMADLVGHDRRPASFIVYLYLCRVASRAGSDLARASLQDIASHTGLSKSSVQQSLRHLAQRSLIDAQTKASVSDPVRRVLRPWSRR